MKATNFLKEGQLVYLNPKIVGNKMFSGCIMVITELKSWGATGYVQSLGNNGKPGGQAHYRAEWEEMDLVGNINGIEE